MSPDGRNSRIRVQAVNIEEDKFPYGEETFDTVSSANHRAPFSPTPCTLLTEIRRVLNPAASWSDHAERRRVSTTRER